MAPLNPKLKAIIILKPIVACGLIALVGLVSYSNTFTAPFQWDDKYYIAENPIVKDLKYFANPSMAKGMELYGALKGRYAGYLTFALNYRLHGIEVAGYHVFNLAVHILNGILVFYLLRLTLQSPALLNSAYRERAQHIALFTALLFVSHPLETEAVTYVFQRLASLAAFFYMGALVLYAKWRLNREIASPSARKDDKGGVIARSKATKQSKLMIFYFLSLLSAVLAMKTKENAFTLPVVIAIYEGVFFTPLSPPLNKGGIKRGYRLLYLAPFMLTMLIVPLSLLGIERPAGEIIGGIGPATRGFQEISRVDYLFTELRVVVTYIRLLFVPVGQNVDHDYPVYGSFFSPPVVMSFLLISAIFSAALYLLYASRKKSELRLPAFGMIWFFVTLSVESSVIPIPMVINEYRAYLPSAGFFAAVVSGLYMTAAAGRKKTTLTALLIIMTMVFSFATFKRNALWASGTALWEDSVGKSPLKARPHNNLGLAYMEAGLREKAEGEFKAALRLKPDYVTAHYNLALAYKNSGRTEEAIEHFEVGLRIQPDAEAHNSLGAIYGAKGMGEKSAEHYMAAISLKPDFAEAHFNLGLFYIENGLPGEAEREFGAVLELRPGDADAMRFLEYAGTLR